MAKKKTTAKSSVPSTLPEQIRDLLSTVPGLSGTGLEAETARAVRLLEKSPDLQARLKAGTLTAEQLLGMVSLRAEVSLGEKSRQHTQHALDRYFSGNRTS